MTLHFHNNAPYSTEFEDIYFNPKEGLLETEYVFLQANRLQERLAKPGSFSIGELGFGTGLNFLASLKLWLSLPEPKAHLHYFSIEKYPLAPVELEQVHKLFPELAKPAELLQKHYPPLLTGFHTIPLISNQVSLYLLVGDVDECLAQIEGPIDAWFLDGFAPSKNESMWSERVMATLAKRSGSTTTLSTFSAAGKVRQALEKFGFCVEKRKGFGIKREMITARYSKDFVSPISPWFARPQPPTGKKVAVIGAGLAGLMTAFQLQEQGFELTIFDKASSLPNHQCQNPALLLRPYLSPDLNFLDQYCTAGFLGMRRFIAEHAPAAVIANGLETILTNAKQLEKDTKITTKRSIPIDFSAWAQVIDPLILTKQLIHKIKAPIHLSNAMDPFKLSQDFDVVVIATGAYSQFGKPTPGQVSIMTDNDLSRSLPPLAYEGYCIPDGQGRRILGSSFRHDTSLEIYAKDHQQNLTYLQKVAPDLADAFSSQPWQAFVGMRFTTKDHLPIVGGLPRETDWYQAYERLRFGDKRPSYPLAPYEKGIYLNLAHGSKGLTSSFLASQIIVSLLGDTPLPIGIQLWEALQAARFWFRRLIRYNSSKR